MTLTWAAPAQNVGGTALTDIAGYLVRWGTSPTNLPNVVQVVGASATSATVSGLSAGTYYFAVVTVNMAGESSPISNVVSKVVN